jgi:hypothetical protein
MSFTLDLTINPVILVVGFLAGGLLGFVTCWVLLARSKAKIKNLEAELLTSNQETLEAQSALVALEARLKDQTIPVIPMKINGNKENPKEKMKS